MHHGSDITTSDTNQRKNRKVNFAEWKKICSTIRKEYPDTFSLCHIEALYYQYERNREDLDGFLSGWKKFVYMVYSTQPSISADMELCKMMPNMNRYNRHFFECAKLANDSEK